MLIVLVLLTISLLLTINYVDKSNAQMEEFPTFSQNELLINLIKKFEISLKHGDIEHIYTQFCSYTEPLKFC